MTLEVKQDGGWAWLVVVGAFISHFLTCGYEKGYSVLYVEIIDEFETSAAMAAGISGVSAAIRLLLGIGLMLVYTPSLIICTSYFKKRRATAVGLSLSGCGFAAIALPYLIVFLIDSYSYDGAILVLSAISLHYCVSGALFLDLNGEQFGKIKAKSCCFKRNPEQIHTLDIQKITRDRNITRSFRNCLEYFKNPWLTLFLTSFCFNMMGSGPVTTLIVHYATELGIKRIHSVQLLAIEGSVQIVVRIIAGFILDHPKIKPHRGIIWSFFIAASAVNVFLISFAKSLLFLAILMFFRGLCLAVYISQQAVIAADMCEHSPDNLKKTIGYTQIGKGTGVLLGSWISGAIKDYADKYGPAFLFLSTMQLIGSIMAFVSVLAVGRSLGSFGRLSPRQDTVSLVQPRSAEDQPTIRANGGRQLDTPSLIDTTKPIEIVDSDDDPQTV